MVTILLMDSLATRLKSLRQEKNLLLRDVAAVVGVKVTTVARWERGEREPQIENINKLCDFFHCTADYLLGRTED